MEQPQFTIWTNANLPIKETDVLAASVLPHRLLYATEMSSLNLKTCPPDLQLAQADIAFGQPDADQIIRSPKLKWVHLTTAGYTPYDRDDLREALRTRNARLTTSSGVYSEPCAQHVLAMMMAFARGIPESLCIQLDERSGRLLNVGVDLFCSMGRPPSSAVMVKSPCGYVRCLSHLE